MICPQCGRAKARRACPALGASICSVCCGTKRLTEIACPADCGYLVAAREHPPAAAVRRQQHDLSSLMHLMQDLNERQGQLFVLLNRSLLAYRPPELHALIDQDVAEAADALAHTYETAVKGVIYEHRAASLPAERLVTALKPLLAEAGRSGGTAFERDAAVVLRRIASAARPARADDAGRRAYLDLVGRVLRGGGPAAEASDPAGSDEPRLIVP